MADKEKFPVPVSGQPIPRGWFARLVLFINSLVLHGDNQYTQVNRTDAGTTITLTPSLINELTKAAAPPSAATITAAFDTNSVTLSVGAGSVTIVGTGSVTISGNTSTGEIEIHGATSGGGGGSVYPVWGSLVAQSIVPSWDAANENMDPEILTNSGFLYVSLAHAVNVSENDKEQHIYCYVSVDGREVFAFQRDIELDSYVYGDPVPVTLSDYGQLTTMVPVAAGSTVTAHYYDSSGASPGLAFTLYKDTSA